MASRATDNRFMRFFLRRKRVPVTPWEGLTTGAWCCSQAVEPFICTGEIRKYQLPGAILLFNGSMLLALGTVTICAAGTMLRLVLISLVQILYVSLILDSIAGAISIAQQTTARMDALPEAMLRDLSMRFGREPIITFGLDAIHRNFNCCGVAGPSDWSDTFWARNVWVGDPEGHLPLSCCQEETHWCNRTSPYLNKNVCIFTKFN
ncbi:hypothetical protein CDAR_318601 [Caerostris darwini]|uniref:Tetraspanin n=1 Tax=Caerostris darwini TaxID=1538125 RepID=A0AAV4Q8Z1_9ARAC|nr:hypothetical protein CDAR_318601 [Caerostris darwini]